MQAGYLIKYWYIKCCRYLLNKKYLKVISGPLKGMKWPTSRSYEYIIGNYEPAEVINEFYSWLKPGSVFYDIGSNIGYFSFIANTIISSGKIYAFEPTVFNNDIFKKLVLLNHKKLQWNNIELKEFAISDTEKEVHFSNNKIFAEGNTYVAGLNSFAGEKVRVTCYSIDSLVKMGYAPPDVLKIDVEGAELDVLKGAKDTLLKYTPHILLATHNCKVPGIKEKCIFFLEESGYILKHTGYQNKSKPGLDDYIAIHRSKFNYVNKPD